MPQNFTPGFFLFPAYLVTAEESGRLGVYKWDAVSKFTLYLVGICVDRILFLGRSNFNLFDGLHVYYFFKTLLCDSYSSSEYIFDFTMTQERQVVILCVMFYVFPGARVS